MHECAVCMEDVYRLVVRHGAHAFCASCTAQLRGRPCPLCREPPPAPGPPWWLGCALRLLGASWTCRVAPSVTDNEAAFAAVVARDGRALRFGSERLRDCTAVVAAAVAHTGDALYYASDAQRGSKPIVLAAVRQDRGAWLWIRGPALWDDPDVRAALLLRRSPGSLPAPPGA
jgi:hypothetical protein